MARLGKIIERKNVLGAANINNPAVGKIEARPLAENETARMRADVTTNQPLEASKPSFAEPMQMDKPTLQTMKPEDMLESQRNNYVQSFKTWGDAEKAGDISQKEYANAHIQKMVAEGKNPGDYLNMMQWLGDAETPEQKAKRERREALGETFQGLGNLIGNVANVYYTHRGGQYIDLNSVNEKHRERMQRIKDKQDALDRQREQILINAKLAADKRKAEQAAKDKDNAFKLKFNAYLKELDDKYKRGQIDAQTKAKLAEQAAKAKSDKELESFKQSNRIALKTTPSSGDSKILTSLTGDDGGTWTRNTNLSEEELRELSKYVEDWTPYTTVDENGKKTIDFYGALADASDSGLIPSSVLEEKGFKRSKDSARRKKQSIEGFNDEDKKNNTIPGF